MRLYYDPLAQCKVRLTETYSFNNKETNMTKMRFLSQDINGKLSQCIASMRKPCESRNWKLLFFKRKFSTFVVYVKLCWGSLCLIYLGFSNFIWGFGEFIFLFDGYITLSFALMFADLNCFHNCLPFELFLCLVFEV